MGRVMLGWLLLVEILLVQAMANRSGGSDPYPLKLTVRAELPVEAHGVGSSVADPPVSSDGEDEWGVAEAPEIRRLGKHHSFDKSVAGGGVIIGGLVTAIFAAVYCYIRVTRRNNGDKH